MSSKIRKIIHHVQNETGFLETIRSYKTEVEIPSLVGDVQALPPPDKLESYRYSTTKLFNRANNASITVDVGQYGLYLLELMPGKKLKKIFIVPESLRVELFMGSHGEGLEYFFYNPTATQFIHIEAVLEHDNGKTYKQIQANPNDLSIRKKIVNNAVQSLHQKNDSYEQSEGRDDEKSLVEKYIRSIEEVNSPYVPIPYLQKKTNLKRNTLDNRLKSARFNLLLLEKVKKKLNMAKTQDKKELWLHVYVDVKDRIDGLVDRMGKNRKDDFNEEDSSEEDFPLRRDGGKTKIKRVDY